MKPLPLIEDVGVLVICCCCIILLVVVVLEWFPPPPPLPPVSSVTLDVCIMGDGSTSIES